MYPPIHYNQNIAIIIEFNIFNEIKFLILHFLCVVKLRIIFTFSVFVDSDCYTSLLNCMLCAR